MERFSDNAIEIINDLHTERLAYNSEYIPLIDAAQVLSDYEDTGLSPTEIKVLKEKLEEKERACKLAIDKIDKVTHKLITAEKKLARYEQAGQLLVLPCKIGDTIYVIPSKVNYDLNKLSHPENNRVYQQIVSGIRMYHRDDYLLETCEGLCIVLESYFKNTWFLTKEEAKAALEERE